MPLLHERLQLPRVAALILVERTLHRFVPDDKQVLEDTFLLRVDDAILSIPTHKGERRVCEWNHERHCLSQRRRLLKHFSPARVRRPSAACCSGCCSAPPSSCRCVPGRQTSPHGHAWPEIARTTRASQLVVCATSAQSPESWSHHDARGCRPVPFVPRPAPDSVTGAAGGPHRSRIRAKGDLLSMVLVDVRPPGRYHDQHGGTFESDFQVDRHSEPR